MPARERSEHEPAGADAASEPMTREQWIAYHVARAPKITRQQWTDTLLLLRTRKQRDNDKEDERKAS
jgi:hypothetical protein